MIFRLKITSFKGVYAATAKSALLCFALATTALTANAQTDGGLPDAVQDRAIRIAKIIEGKTLIIDTQLNTMLDDPRSDIERLQGLRIQIGDALSERIPDDLTTLNSSYLTLAKQLGSEEDIAISNLVRLYEIIASKGPNHQDVTKDMAELRSLQSDENWFIANRALQIEAILQARSYDLSTALRLSQNALKIIPNTVSNKTLEASYEVNSVIGTVYFMLGNFELGMQATEDLINQGQILNRKIDGITLLNNMIYCAEKWREAELTASLSQISLRLVRGQGNKSEIIAIIRAGQAYNNLQRYEDAMRLLNVGLALNPSDNWRINLETHRAIALAGMGKESEARRAFSQVLALSEGNPRYAGKFEQRKREIDALIAASQGRSMDVFRIMKDRGNTDLQNMLRLQSADTLKLTALVDNSKAAQEANEAKYRAETTLKQRTITAQKKRLKYLNIITAMFGLMLFAALAFSWHQRRSAKIVARLKDKALAGEEAKSQFLAVMSHELRTPLNGIIGLADILSREGPDKDVRFKNGIILKSGYNLLDLLTNILDMSKMETGKLSITPSPTDIRDIVTSLEQLWLPQTQKKGLNFTVFVAANVPSLLDLDSMRLRQCLENLISNAIKFTAAGRVHMHVTYENDPQNMNGNLKIIVADTGTGMTPEKCSQIFEPFTQADTTISRSHGGSGLGLAITRSLSRLMGGDTIVKSALHRGSEFTLTLKTRSSQGELDQSPLLPSAKEHYLLAEAEFNRDSQPPHLEPPLQTPYSEAPVLPTYNAPVQRAETPEPLATHTPKPASTSVSAPLSEPVELSAPAPTLPTAPTNRAHSADPFRGLNVLIVEDVTSNQEVLKIFLEPMGCNVSCASNGHEALSAMQSSPFDVVLMDIRMPEMDGIEATRAIRAQDSAQAGTPIIALTADASAENNAKCMAAGADVFLTKPVVASELFGSIRFVLSQAQRRKDDQLKNLTAS